MANQNRYCCNIHYCCSIIVRVSRCTENRAAEHVGRRVLCLRVRGAVFEKSEISAQEQPQAFRAQVGGPSAEVFRHTTFCRSGRVRRFGFPR